MVGNSENAVVALMNVWFGTDWGAPVCHDMPQIPVPVGRPCLYCTEPIAADDSGIATPLMESVGNAIVVSTAYYHVECWGRSLLGSVGHQLRLCSCYGGTEDCEPDGMSKRETARAAWDLARARARRVEGSTD